MGSPSFGYTDNLTLGYQENLIVSDGEIADYRSLLDDEQNDPESPFYVYDDDVIQRLREQEAEYAHDLAEASQKLADVVNQFLWETEVNPLALWEQQIVRFVVETASYDNSHRIIINNVCEVKPDQFSYQEFYEFHHYTGTGYQHPTDLPYGMTFEQFKNCADKSIDFADYVLREIATKTFLKGIDGGWSGLSHTLSPNSDSDHERFKYQFDRLWARLKDADICYLI